ncbi:hypothetical protein IAU59_004204 [Kwoniella sp. CBS 9459]
MPASTLPSLTTPPTTVDDPSGSCATTPLSRSPSISITLSTEQTTDDRNPTDPTDDEEENTVRPPRTDTTLTSRSNHRLLGPPSSDRAGRSGRPTWGQKASSLFRGNPRSSHGRPRTLLREDSSAQRRTWLLVEYSPDTLRGKSDGGAFWCSGQRWADVTNCPDIVRDLRDANKSKDEFAIEATVKQFNSHHFLGGPGSNFSSQFADKEGVETIVPVIIDVPDKEVNQHRETGSNPPFAYSSSVPECFCWSGPPRVICPPAPSSTQGKPGLEGSTRNV